MYVFKDKSKNGKITYYIHKSYRDENGNNKKSVIKNLGSHEDLARVHPDPEAWAREYAKQLTAEEKEGTRTVIMKLSQSNRIPKGVQTLYSGGYLFLQKLYYELGLNTICREISNKYKFDFDLNSVLSRLVYGRILEPCSKRSTYSFSKTLLEKPQFEEHHLYRALDVISKENDFIQSQLYENSVKLSKRNDNILYYDCTNFFFEIEEEDDFREYGKCKENRPLPIVEMGLFIDADGIPLAFSMHSGSTNEQVTLRPLEKKIIEDFKHSKFVVCTDAGLASNANRVFNNKRDRGYITVQSLKKMKKERSKKFMQKDGWRLCGDKSNTKYDLGKIAEDDALRKQYHDACFYKDEWFIDKVQYTEQDGSKKKHELEQRYITTFSFKYMDYQRHIREAQVSRAEKMIESGDEKLKKRNQNDCRRFIESISSTKDGEIADNTTYRINNAVIENEAQYDGFYCTCTDLEGSVEDIVKVNHRRWEIEECFRIMKSEFKARPVYLQKEARIRAHFVTCFLALYLLRYMEKILGEKYTYPAIISGLRDMKFHAVKSEGYVPVYTRTDFTDDLHELFGFKTDFEIVSRRMMKKIFTETKQTGDIAQKLS